MLKAIDDKSGYQPDLIVLNKAQLAEELCWQKKSMPTATAHSDETKSPLWVRLYEQSL